jgi:excisionase family DNA binding protein
MGTLQPRLPTEEDIASAKAYSRELARYADKDRVHVKLSADGQSSEDLVVPGHLVELMLRVATEVSMGHGVNILPIHSELTTQQAANLLNISRPYLVSLLKDGTIAHHKVGSHRRVLAHDVLAFQKTQRRARAEALDEMAALSAEMGLYDEPQP